jgi:hypothetical protein
MQEIIRGTLGAGTGAGAGALAGGEDDRALGALLGAGVGGTGAVALGRLINKMRLDKAGVLPDSELKRLSDLEIKLDARSGQQRQKAVRMQDTLEDKMIDRDSVLGALNASRSGGLKQHEGLPSDLESMLFQLNDEIEAGLGPMYRAQRAGQDKAETGRKIWERIKDSLNNELDIYSRIF